MKKTYRVTWKNGKGEHCEQVFGKLKDAWRKVRAETRMNRAGDIQIIQETAANSRGPAGKEV